MKVFYKKDNHKNKEGTGSKFSRVISLSLMLSAIFLSVIFVTKYTADRLYTARDQGIVDGEESNSPRGDNTNDTDSTPDVKDTKLLNPSVSKVSSRLTTHTAILDPHACIQYDSLTREIKITCESTNLAQVNEILNDPKILKKEGDGIWPLNANLTISDGASFTIDSNDT